MSLIKCVECGNQISDLTEACPNCGCPLSYSVDSIQRINRFEPLKEKNKWMGYAGLGLGLAFILVYLLAILGFVG